MSEDWNTKYGPRRVRRDPPTLDEAIFAAIGITDDQQAQAEIAASLMGLPIEAVTAEVKKIARTSARSTTRVIAGEQGAQRSIVVERRVVRKFGNDKRTGTFAAERRAGAAPLRSAYHASHWSRPASAVSVPRPFLSFPNARMRFVTRSRKYRSCVTRLTAPGKSARQSSRT